MNFQKLVGQFKVYVGRATGWVGIFNSILLVANFKLLYEIPIPFWALVPLGFLGVIIVGYIDYKLFYRAEWAYSNAQNDIKHQLDRIERKL